MVATAARPGGRVAVERLREQQWDDIERAVFKAAADGSHVQAPGAVDLGAAHLDTALGRCLQSLDPRLSASARSRPATIAH